MKDDVTEAARPDWWGRPRAALLVVAALAAMLAAMPSPGMVAAPGDDDRVETQVVGGRAVPDGKYPFIAAVLNRRNGRRPYDRQYCAGSLIDARHVLTAAHCVGPHHRRKDLRVIVGRTVLQSGQGQMRGVAQIWVHPDYAATRGNAYDVAILVLGRPVHGVEPIALATAADASLEEPGAATTVAGWGSTVRQPARGRPRRPQYPDRMREASLPIVADAACAAAYERLPPGARVVPALMLCAGAAGIDSCQGDSGGPLFASGPDGVHQIGIVSYGVGCADDAFPGVYTQVSAPAIADFIHQVIETAPARA